METAPLLSSRPTTKPTRPLRDPDPDRILLDSVQSPVAGTTAGGVCSWAVAASIEVFDLRDRKRAHVDLPLEFLDGNRDGRRRGRGPDCGKDFWPDRAGSSYCHQDHYRGQGNQNLYHGKPPVY